MAFDRSSRFESFLPGSNTQALEHLRALAESGADAAAPVYLWGPSGSGKTHLLSALADHLQQQGARVGWFGAGDSLPWSFDEHWRLIVLDSADAFDPAQQHAAFSLFVQASSLGMAVAASGRLPPVDLPLRDDLRTRLGWGHVLALQPLSEAQSRAALRREADHRGILLSDEVLDFLLSRFARDLKHLMALLDRLDTFGLARQRAITVPLLKQMLTEEGVA